MLNPITSFKSFTVKGLTLCNRYRGVPIAFAASMILSNQLNKRIDLAEGWSKRRMFSAILPYMLVGAAMAYHRATRKASAITTALLGTMQNGGFCYLGAREIKRQEDTAKLFAAIRAGEFSPNQYLSGDNIKFILSQLPPKKSQELALISKQFLKAYLDMKLPMDEVFRKQWKLGDSKGIISEMYPTHIFKTLEDVKEEVEILELQNYESCMISMPTKKLFEKIIQNQDQIQNRFPKKWLDECKEPRSLLGFWSGKIAAKVCYSLGIEDQRDEEFPEYRFASPLEFTYCCITNNLDMKGVFYNPEYDKTKVLIINVRNSEISIQECYARRGSSFYPFFIGAEQLLVKEV